MQPTHPPIELLHAAKRFGNVEVLKDATFRIAPGEHACLLGPNGAGKTTIIRLLTGALLPTHGSVRLFGIATHDRAFLDAKRRVGVVPQSPGMYRDMTVMAYLRLVHKLYRKGNTNDALLRFGLVPYRDRPLAELSGGVQRRVLLAAAMLPEPDLLLLDEPTVGLDPVAIREVHAFLRDAMAGRSMLLCTHNLAEAEALCDSAVIVQRGRVLLHESFATLHRRTQPHLILSAVEGVEPLARVLRQLGCVPTAEGDRVVLPVVDPQRDAPWLLRRLLSADLNVYVCQIRVPTLEETFVDLVGADSHA